MDGLRGVAVIAVMLFHAQWPGAQGGFIGVDVFFVLSGFLITTQLLDELNRTGRVRWQAFFMRRAVRLQPALLILLAAYALAANGGLLPPSAARAWLSDIGVVALALTHWTRAFNWHAPDYLGHTWSLGIEEQFYMLWALTMVLSARAHLSKRRMEWLATGAMLTSAGWMALLYTDGASASRMYNGLDTRAAALLAGCTLALVLERCTPALLYSRLVPSPIAPTVAKCWRRIGIAALLLLTAGAGTLDWKHPGMFLVGYTLVASLTAGLIASIVIAPTEGCASMLSHPLLVTVGRWSYGLYLWHYPIYRIAEDHGAQHGIGLGTCMAVGSALTVAVAASSYYLVESPLRRRFKHSRSAPTNA